MKTLADFRAKLNMFNDTFTSQVACHPALDLEDDDMDVDHVADLVSQISELLDEANTVMTRRVERDEVDWDE